MSQTILYDYVKTITVKNVLKGVSDPKFVILQYKHKGCEVTYRINLASVPSNLGIGRIWYFLCPVTAKRCRKLYFIHGKFLHREAFSHCFYSSQMTGKHWRQIKKLADRTFLCERVYTKIESKYFKRYYAGKPTKRYRQLILQLGETAPQL
jgi:hypothetical protein